MRNISLLLRHENASLYNITPVYRYIININVYISVIYIHRALSLSLTCICARVSRLKKLRKSKLYVNNTPNVYSSTTVFFFIFNVLCCQITNASLRHVDLYLKTSLMIALILSKF